MLTALGAVSGAVGGLAYAQRKRNALIVDAVRAGQAVGALAVVRALEEGDRSDGDRVKRAALANEAARNIGCVAVRHQVAICRAVEDGAAPEVIAQAMDGPCCMAARRTRLRDRDQTVNASTFRALLDYVDQQHRAANAAPEGGTLHPAAAAARLANVINAEAAVVLAWLKFTRDARAAQFQGMIADNARRMQSAKEIHRMFRAVEAQAREAADTKPERDPRRARPRRVGGGLTAFQRQKLADHLVAIDRLTHAAVVNTPTNPNALARREHEIRKERAIWLMTYLRFHANPAWRAMLDEVKDPRALARRAAQVHDRFTTLRRRFEESA